MGSAVYICGVADRCERHDLALHGMDCYGCQQEWERKSPRVREAIRKRGTGPADMKRAREADAAAFVAYDGPHDVEVERAGTSGPVRHLWNALCTEGCGWSHYWLKSKVAAADAGRDHLNDPPPRRRGW